MFQSQLIEILLSAILMFNVGAYSFVWYKIWEEELEQDYGWIKQSKNGNQNLYFRISQSNITIQRPTYIEANEEAIDRLIQVFDHINISKEKDISWEVSSSGSITFTLSDLSTNL